MMAAQVGEGRLAPTKSPTSLVDIFGGHDSSLQWMPVFLWGVPEGLQLSSTCLPLHEREHPSDPLSVAC